MFLGQAGPPSGEIPEIANHHGWDIAGTQESVLQQFRDPLTILRVRLAPGNCLNVLRVGQHDLKVAFQHVPHRFPINPRGLHRHVLHPKLTQPCNQFAEFACSAAKTTNVLYRFTGLREQNASCNRGLMYIRSAAPRIQKLHGGLLPPCDVRMRKSRKSPSRAPLRREGYSLLFSEASRVKLNRGLFGPTKADDRIRPRP